MKPLFKRLAVALSAAVLLGAAPQAQAFCGFFVAKGDAKLFNEASKVVMVRDGDRTVITMVNDFQGDAKDFAMVVPAPEVLQRGQIHVTENAVVDHLDAFTAPRLVEYFDPDPCQPVVMERMMTMSAVGVVGGRADAAQAKALGVTIEAQYLVGEYDILILSAEQSDGLETWLNQNGYNVPEGASAVLGSYIRQGMKFFVAKVNLEEHAKQGGGVLRPLQLAFESPKFMLPIRLGMVNSKGSQDLLLYTLTRTGRVETANYRTVRMPTDAEIPVMVRDRFGDTYKAIYAAAVGKEGGAAVLLEYAWDMGWCDPCAADPLSADELRELGVFWVGQGGGGGVGIRAPQPAQDVFVTRLHARYDAESFPEDLRLTETGDRQNFQGRYILRHAFTGEANCPAGEQYRQALPRRWDSEAQQLASLTGWDINEIRAEMAKYGTDPAKPPQPQPWWKSIWKD
ncbi:MAG TPA: DUF2330 domain-containing protein [Thermohalobaculum sp.]|nr:DUF2330 domain-containing protein [Thermohalobaculum sp.]